MTAAGFRGLLLGCLLLLGATAARAQDRPPNLAPGPAKTTATTPLPPASGGLATGDKVQFFVAEDPVKGTAPLELIVSPTGDLSFPVSRGNADVLIPMNVRGKSVAQVRAELTAKLNADYYQNATVFLRVTAQTPRRGDIFFRGEVQQKILPLAAGEKLTLFEALLRVGTTEWANLKKVQLYRQAPGHAKAEPRVFDVDAMLKGDRSKDLELEDQDLVNVPTKTLRLF